MATLKDYQKYWQKQSAKDEEDKSEQLKILRQDADKAARTLAKEFQQKGFSLWISVR